MEQLRDPAISIAAVLAIGILCGLAANAIAPAPANPRPRKPWLTALLVGVAGSFIGFHGAMLANMATGAVLVPFASALTGSALVLWGWIALTQPRQ